jgi:hypothetical protein
LRKTKNRHENLSGQRYRQSWKSIQKNWSLNEMENTGGEPDVVSHDKKTDEFLL